MAARRRKDEVKSNHNGFTSANITEDDITGDIATTTTETEIEGVESARPTIKSSPPPVLPKPRWIGPLAPPQSEKNAKTNSSIQVFSRSPSPSSMSQRQFGFPSSSVIQSAYQHGSQAAFTAANQIEADKKEAQNIIANHAVDPLEMLHLVDRWLQQLLSEFLVQRDHFKYKLKEKWEKQELFINSENNTKTRNIYFIVKELKQAMDKILSRSSFDETNNYITKLDYQNLNLDELKEKFDLLFKQYFKIIESLEYIDRETKGNDTYIKSTKETLLKLRALSEKATHTICIIGLEKAGKSTFINALLGFELLPTASERCTQIRTVLKPPLPNHPQRFATITYYNDYEFKSFFDKMTKKTDDNDEQFEKRKREIIDEHENLKRKFPQEHFDLTARDGNGTETERRRIISQLHDYIKGELYVNIVKEIEIYTDKLPGENYELLDVPGFDSPIKEHRDAGLKAIEMADAFLFLTSGQSPSLTEPQIRLLHEIQTHHNEAMQRAFGIITKLDLCQTPVTYRDHFEKAQGELVDKRFNPAHIFAACPRMELLDENSDEFAVIAEKLRNFGDLQDGFEQCKTALNEFIQYELPKTHLKQLIDLGKMKLLRFVSKCLETVKQRGLLPENLAVMSIDEYIKVQNTENWDQYYHDVRFLPTFAKANDWHTTVITKNRSEFIDDAKKVFHDRFLNSTNKFMQSQHPIEQIMCETYGFSKLQLNAHPPDNTTREKLSFELEKIVDTTSNELAEHFYHSYICKLEDILNEISPEEKDLFRTKLSLDKCKYETHTLILRVCRPVIMATLRYSHLDLNCKQEAIRELIHIAPIVAYNIANTDEQDNDGILHTEIPKLAELLIGYGDGMVAKLMKSLFNL